MVFSPVYLVVMNWVFPLRFRFIGLNTFMDLRTLDVCLAMNTRGDNGASYWFTWYAFWQSTRGFPRWHWGNLCIGVDARSCLCFSGRNLGALFEILCVGLSIRNLKLFGVILVWTLLVDRSERIATINFFLCSLLDRNFGVILHRILRDGRMIQLY